MTREEAVGLPFCLEDGRIGTIISWWEGLEICDVSVDKEVWRYFFSKRNPVLKGVDEIAFWARSFPAQSEPILMKQVPDGYPGSSIQ